MSELVPTLRELQALKVLWEQRQATVRELWKIMSTVKGDMISADGDMNTADGDLAYTTVLSLMQVMEQKGLVAHRVEGKAYVYFAKVERQSVFQRLAGGFLDRVFDGAVDEYLVHALSSRRPSAAELDRLEQLIADAKKRPRGKRK